MAKDKHNDKALSRAKRGLRNLGRGAENALHLLRHGRLGAPYSADHDVVTTHGFAKLRRYGGRFNAGFDGEQRSTVLLIPPLMVTAEIYDISPELSSVTFLSSRGVDVWGVDFGTPEEEEGGLQRTLDEHIVAVDEAIDEVVERTGRPVHLVGYSQGGMFAYQAAAYRECAQIASVITFGSPVDLRRNLPFKLNERLVERAAAATRGAIGGALDELKGLPGTLTSAGFKLLSPRAEVRQLVTMLGLLHDRESLEKVEPRRRFLGGEGFIAWPGPAFRSFVDNYVINNRLRSGGMVIAGRTVSLSAIRVPILYFVGERDDFARPESVRAISKSAVDASTYEVMMPAGHFGLVVGSRAMTLTWPTVAQWVHWQDGTGEMPTALRKEAPPEASEPEQPEVQTPPPEEKLEQQEDAKLVQRLYDIATEAADGLWHRMGEASVELTDVVGAMRWQLPRLARLLSIEEHSRINIGRLVQEQADAIGSETFFLWQKRAYTYAEANSRINQVARVLVDLGVEPGSRVALLLDNHPDYLTSVVAVSRLGGVSVLLNTGLRGSSLQQALEVSDAAFVVCDEAHLKTVEHLGRKRGGPKVAALGVERAPRGVTALNGLIAEASTTPPNVARLNPGRAHELAMLLFTSGTTGLPKVARITNRRQVSAALWSAIASELTPRDTVYCCLPLHHATGMLVAVGGALVGGCRLALAPKFSASQFWSDVRLYGANVVFYVGELCRYLLASEPKPDDRQHPVKKLIGNGMQAEVWSRMLHRFGEMRVLEFYGSTEGNIVLGNLTGNKVGSVGQPITGAGEVALVRYDSEQGGALRDEEGRALRCAVEEPGLLLGRIDTPQPLARFDGYDEAEATEAKILRDVFEPGDAWFNSGDLLRRDEDGDFWFVDRVGDTFRWKGENVSTTQVASVLAEAPFVALAAVYGINLPEREGRAGMAALELKDGAAFDGKALFELASAHLPPAARPRFVRIVEKLDVTGSLKLQKQALQAEGADPEQVEGEMYWYDERKTQYSLLDMRSFLSLILNS